MYQLSPNVHDIWGTQVLSSRQKGRLGRSDCPLNSSTTRPYKALQIRSAAVRSKLCCDSFNSKDWSLWATSIWRMTSGSNMEIYQPKKYNLWRRHRPWSFLDIRFSNTEFHPSGAVPHLPNANRETTVDPRCSVLPASQASSTSTPHGPWCVLYFKSTHFKVHSENIFLKIKSATKNITSLYHYIRPASR